MKIPIRKVISVAALVWVVLTTGCRSYTYKLAHGDPQGHKLGLSFAREDRMERSVDSMYRTSLPEIVEITDDNGKSYKIVQSVQNEDGTSSPFFELRGVTVVARNRNIAERNGKINMDFIVTVPKPLIDRKWQLRVYPRAFKQGDERIDLDPIVLSGADFLKKQKEGYEQYKRFIASIVPDSLYWREMINQKGVQKALADLENDYYRAWKKDLLMQNEWIDWREKINRRYMLFNSEMKRNRSSIDPETSLLAVLPAYWLERDFTKRVVPTTFAEYAWGNKSIVKKTVTPEDSLEINRKFTLIHKIAENERKREQQEAMYRKMVRFPHVAARLDTIVDGGNEFRYYYTQELMADSHIKRIDLVLNGEVVAIDESRYDVPRSDTLTYFVSAMVDFLDEAPRYKTKVIYRNELKSVSAKIDFKVGSSVIDPDLSQNKSELERVREFAGDLERVGEFVLDSLSLVGYASPEGSSLSNRLLSQRRTEEIKRYVEREHLFGRLPHIYSRTGGENWEGFSSWITDTVHGIDPMVQQSLLSLISSIKDEDQREERIRSQYPSLYTRLREDCYPTLRTTEFRFYTHRANMVKDTVHTNVIDEEYNKGRELLRQREYRAALEILSSYEKDFNLAVCALSLGHNAQARRILESYCDLRNSDVQYLLAIVYMRLGEAKKSLEYLLKSTDQDRRKIFRAQLDPELNKLIKEYKLFGDVLEF